LEGVDTIQNNDSLKNYIAKSWKQTCTVIGIDGLPSCGKAGNVVHPTTNITISIRMPPTLDVKKAVDFTIKELSRDPPYNAHVKVTCPKWGNGINANEMRGDF